MYKLITVLILVVLLGCSDHTRKNLEQDKPINDNPLKGELNEVYTYKAISEDLTLGFSKFLDPGIYEGEESARFRGSLLALFGEPLYQSDNAEDAYHYVIEVSDDTSKWHFMVYDGPSGPAIGYDQKENQPNAIESAKVLLEKIREAPPSDFNEIIYYEDFGSKITYGCKNGECFYKEENEESH
ncbi:hypothetical protein [Saccharibacillus endophyticus]|uniref:Lipoprotein n=1 Tax=Saccharibacillus endophyticus TaxID=2060666 RepID=A0ABQ2A287_9BACL|nr:hypothetical protein [Saccharibacillus endophyticus]GGH84736.1 hypothetical protein GCM10007362_40500 [Saccharibacillus endophyticus]